MLRQWKGWMSAAAAILTAGTVLTASTDVEARRGSGDDQSSSGNPSVRVSCEVRQGRSRASVDGRGLVPRQLYHAMLESGALAALNTAVSGAQPADAAGEDEFDFDSDPGDIAEGATPIAPNFIQVGRVTGKILDEAGHTLAAATVRCRVR